MKRRALSVVLALILICTLAIPVLAINDSQKFNFSLTVGDLSTTDIKVNPGDEFVVDFYLIRTDIGAGDTYPIYMMQNEILYNTDYLEFVSGKSEILVSGFPDIGTRSYLGAVNRIMINSGHGFYDSSRMFPASLHVAKLTFRAIKDGITDISCINCGVSPIVATGLADSYASTAGSVKATIGNPTVTKHNITIVNPTGGTITTSPSGSAAAGEVVTLNMNLNTNYSFSSWKITTGAADVEVSGSSQAAGARFVMPAAPVTVTTAALNYTGGSGTGTPGGGSSGGTPSGDTNIDDNETPLAAPEIPRFSDVGAGHWAYIFVEYLAELKFVNGKTDTTYAPSDTITRGEFITILARMSGESLPEYSGQFTDVAASAFYAQPVAWGFASGIVKGTSDTTFSPNNKISRQDIAAMISRYAEYKDYTFSEVNEAIEFTDAASIAVYAADAVSAMQRASIINGYDDGSFRPRGNATRAESAKMLALVHHAPIIRQ